MVNLEQITEQADSKRRAVFKSVLRAAGGVGVTLAAIAYATVSEDHEGPAKVAAVAGGTWALIEGIYVAPRNLIQYHKLRRQLPKDPKSYRSL